VRTCWLARLCRFWATRWKVLFWRNCKYKTDVLFALVHYLQCVTPYAAATSHQLIALNLVTDLFLQWQEGKARSPIIYSNRLSGELVVAGRSKDTWNSLVLNAQSCVITGLHVRFRFDKSFALWVYYVNFHLSVYDSSDHSISCI
jgi:hypothetical protein